MFIKKSTLEMMQNQIQVLYDRVSQLEAAANLIRHSQYPAYIPLSTVVQQILDRLNLNVNYIPQTGGYWTIKPKNDEEKS